MKKLILLIIVILLATGCTIKNEKYYEMIANTALGFFNSPDYNEKNIDKNDRPAVSKFYSSVTHKNQVIDLTEYIYDNLVSYEKQEICSVEYEEILNEFEEAKAKYEGFGPFYQTTCKGHYAIVYQSDLYPDYEYTLNNPEHNYVLINKFNEDGIRSYVYKSTYNGKGLMLKLHMKNKTIEKIDTEYVNANDYIKN